MAERPSVYFHLEMGVQWRPRTSDGPGSTNHQLTYMSKSARQRAHPQQYQYCQYQYPQQRQSQPGATLWGHHSYYAPPAAVAAPPPPRPLQTQRQSRSDSKSSHERGHSAPPPLSENSWDASPEPMAATALPKRKPPKPQIWKALPPTPAQFRLGHDDMPWSPTPYAAPGTDEYIQGSLQVSPDSAAAQASQPSHRSLDDRDKVRTKEMQSLATAMMTVDNGFEDQWWYQGPRLVNIAGDLIPPAVLAEHYQQGGYVANPATGEIVSAQAADSPAGALAGIVSPVSDFSNSSGSFVLRRSLTTRSEELHMYD